MGVKCENQYCSALAELVNLHNKYIYGHMFSLYMKGSSLLVIIVTSNIEDKQLLGHILSLPMKMSSIPVLIVNMKLHKKSI